MEKMVPKYFGKRKIKSVLAILACFLIWQLIRFLSGRFFNFGELNVHPYYAYMYAVLEMRRTLELAKRNGKIRIKNLFISSVIAFVFIALTSSFRPYITSELLWTVLEITVVMLGVLCCLFLAELFGCGNLCGPAATTFIVLIINHMDDSNVYFYAFMRLVQTVIGVAVAFYINKFIFSPEDACPASCEPVQQDLLIPEETDKAAENAENKEDCPMS